MVNNGMNVLLFDYRGFGKSSPWVMDSTALMYPQFMLDLEAAVKYVKTRKDVDTNNLGLFGISMGAILCSGVAAKHPEIQALVVDGIATSTSDIIKGLYKLKKKKLIVPGGYPPDDEPINAFKKLIHCKIMVIAGDKDLNTPVWMAKKLYGIAPKKGMLRIIKGAKHGYGPVMDENVYTKEIPEFFSSALTK
jgi:predicted alpha/beta hydrolase